MMIDRGFSIENYVGTYNMVKDKEVDATLIVSNEFNYAKDGEEELKKKQIFQYDRASDDYIFLNLAHVDIDSDKSILEYCNKYGLPYSSQISFDEESGVGEDTRKDIARYVNARINDLYQRKDTMDRLEFCRLAVQIRKMLELKVILDREREKDKKIRGLKEQETANRSLCSEPIPLLTYLVFYSRAFIYDYDFSFNYDKDFTDEGALPYTRIMSLQYDFHFACKRNSRIYDKLTPADKIATFIGQCKNLIGNPGRIGDSITVCDLTSEEDIRVLNVFNQIFKEDKALLLVGPEIPVTNQDLQLNVVQIATGTHNQFDIDKYGRIKFIKEIEYNGNVEELKTLGYDVLRNMINEGIRRITPQLVLNNNMFHGDWQLRYQMEGIYMEFFTELALDSQYRFCGNPSCRNIFSASRSRPNKIYCCHDCGNLMGKRMARERNKRRLSNGT